MKFRDMTPIGKCDVCGINLWSEFDGGPAIFPCGIAGCPYETEEQQRAINYERSATGGSLQLPIYETGG